MITETERTSKQTTYQAQLAQRRAHNTALNGGNSDAPFASDVLRNIDPKEYPPSAQFLRSIAEEAIQQAQKGDPNHVTKGLVRVYNERAVR